MKRLTLILLYILPFDIFCQDQIMYVNGGDEYVNKIDSIDNEYLYYRSDSINYQTPLLLTLGYYTTIETEKNLSKKYHKRKRIYHDTRVYNSDTLNVSTHFQSAYINTRLPEGLFSLDYSKGFYVKLNGDTIYCDMAVLKKNADRYTFCVSRINNSDFMVLSAKQIKAYSVDNLSFRSLSISKSSEEEIHQFVVNRIQGNLNLFEKLPSPIDGDNYFLLSKKNSDKYYPLFESDEKSFSVHANNQIMKIHGSYNDIVKVTFEEENLSNSFNKVMAAIIEDCPRTVNKVKNEFYGKSDLILIIKEYNSCM